LRIDSHHSFSGRYPLEHLEAILKRNRFDAGILVGPACWPAQEFVKAVVVRTGTLDPRVLDENQRQPKFRGICYEPAGGEVPADFAELERRGIPLDLVSGLALVPRIAERFPGLRIVLDHVGAPFSGRWPRELGDAAQYPNVFCKLSGLTRISPSPVPYVQHALAVFGPSRLMFGSDWPASLPEHSWKAALAAFTQAIGAQPVEIREELLGGTAARFYAL
jgi:predicted TIM-barrel fold metal-dependent hydrolase